MNRHRGTGAPRGAIVLHCLYFYPGAQKTPGLPGDEWAFWYRDSAPRAGVESRIKGTTGLPVGLHVLAVKIVTTGSIQ
jgi:hypothetical protein